MDMLKIILILSMTVISIDAEAEWMNIYSDENFSIFSDASSISKKGDQVTMRSLYDFKVPPAITTGVQAQSETWEKEFDCQIKKFRPLHMALFAENMGKGTAFRSSDEVGKWTPIQVASLNEIEWKVACGMK